MKKYLVSVQERWTGKVFGYVESEAADSYYAKGVALKQIESEMRNSPCAWSSLKDIDWCLDAVEIE